MDGSEDFCVQHNKLGTDGQAVHFLTQLELIEVWNYAEYKGSNQRLGVEEAGGGVHVTVYTVTVRQELELQALSLGIMITGYSCVLQNI